MAVGEITVSVTELPEVRALVAAAFALDDVVAEFGLYDPSSIGDTYQRFRDALNGFKRPEEWG